MTKIKKKSSKRKRQQPPTKKKPLSYLLLQYEKKIVATELNVAKGNLSAAASALGIDRRSLHNKLQKLKIKRPAKKWKKTRAK